MALPDPRFTTTHTSNYKGRLYQYGDRMQLPATVAETWCAPGYQPKRPDKGIQLTVNDYPFHPIQYGGPKWAEVVHTPFQTDN